MVWWLYPHSSLLFIPDIDWWVFTSSIWCVFPCAIHPSLAEVFMFLHFSVYWWMNPGLSWNLCLDSRSLTFIWLWHSRGSFSPPWVCRSGWYFGTLELVYFSISKKSIMTIVFLVRMFLLTFVSSYALWFVLADGCIPSEAPQICFLDGIPSRPSGSPHLNFTYCCDLRPQQTSILWYKISSFMEVLGSEQYWCFPLHGCLPFNMVLT